MRVRLVYRGRLRSNQRDPIDGQLDKLAEHKHAIRKEFHLQVRTQFSESESLRGHMGDVEAQVGSYRFVPLVRKAWRLSCSVGVLFLRHDPPGSVLTAGDLDNRVKTLIDTLRMPANVGELRGNEQPSSDEDPFFCLLEDDNLVSAIRVETGRLLIPPRSTRDEDRQEAVIVVTADILPLGGTTWFNIGFVAE